MYTDNILENNKDEFRIEDFRNDIERAEYLKSILLLHSTGGEGNNREYTSLRKYFKKIDKNILPRMVKYNNDLYEFWDFIKNEKATYMERRVLIKNEFNNFLELLEEKELNEISIESDILEELNVQYVSDTWKKAIERKNIDPEGAVTSARTLIESVLKSLAEKMDIDINSKGDLPKQYKEVSKELNLSPNQHNEQVFKQILGGCTAIVDGMANLRNDFGDSHGKTTSRYKPSSRHSEFAINIAGSLCVFLIQTYKYNEDMKQSKGVK